MLHMNMQTVVGLAGLAVSFALVYPMLLAKLSLSLASPYAKAESRRRLYAATIDGLLVASIFALDWSSASIAFLAIGAACILLRDAVCGRSLGKFLLGLTVVRLETRRPGSARDSVSRNVIFLYRVPMSPRSFSRRGRCRAISRVALGRPPRHDAGRRRIWRQGSRPGHSSAA